VTQRTSEANGVERDVDHVKDRYGDQAKLYAETRAEAAGTAGLDEDVDHWTTVAERLEQGDGE
jgi:hypothetical protein